MDKPSSGEAPLGRKQRILLAIERFSRRRFRLVFLASLALFAAAVWLGAHIRLESDILNLIPRGNRNVDVFRTALHEFGSIDYLMILLEAGKDEGPDELEDFADLYAEKLRARDLLVENVEYRFQPDAKFMELFSENALLFLPPEQLPAIADKLSDESIRRQVRENRIALASPTATLAEGLVLKDPLGLMPLLVGRLLSHHGALKVDLADGYYLSQDNRTLIMLVKPVHASQDLAFSRQLMTAAREGAEATRAALREDGALGAATEVRFSGNPAILTEETSLLRRTVAINGIVSFVAVTLLYWVCYRRFAALLYSTVPLILGQALTFAVAALVLGSLNSASASLPALLMGLGTDFTIVMYARYVEERQAGATLAEATERMVGEGGLGVFTGAITSAGTFYAMCISSFRGLRDLGFLIGSGILLCGVAILFLLPAMIAWNDGARSRKTDVVDKLHLQSFGLEHLLVFSARHRRAVLAGVLVLAAAGGALALSLDFDESLNSLRSTSAASVQVQAEIAEKFGASLSYMMAIAEGTTVDEAIGRAQQIEERLKPFLADGTVGSYESILNYLPVADRQASVIGALRAGATGSYDPARIRATFRSALAENGFREEPFDAYLGRLGRLLSPEHPITLDDLEGKGLGRLVDRYVHRDPGHVRIVTYLYTRDPRWRRNPPPNLVEALEAGDPGIVVTGTNLVGRELRHVFLRDSRVSVALGLILVAALLWIDFRSFRLTGIALGQLVSGVLMMLGAIKLLGMHINYANAFVATMIMGVGIDYSIHLVHRLHRNGGRTDEGVRETGKGVVMAAATNVAGFGTLAFGSYPAMRSVGVVALIGSVTCLVTALTFVPAMMAVAEDGEPGDGDPR
jgi:predicted RND superfamily exporter protein